MARFIPCLAVLLISAVAFVPAEAQEKGKGRNSFRGFGGGGGFGGNTLAGLGATDAVQKEAGITGDATEKLASLRDDVSAARLKEFQNAGINLQEFQSLSADERQERRDQMTEIEIRLNEEFNPKVKAIVSAEQYKRLQQIQLQANLALRGPGALVFSEIATELKLTDDQKKKLSNAQAEIDAKQRELFTGGGGGGGQAFGKLREERIAKTNEILTAEQKETLNSLKGAAFDTNQLVGGGGGRKGKGN
jgi:hypothetical protein